MKISSNVFKTVVKIWETYPEFYFNLMFIRRFGGLFDGEIEIMSTTHYVMYKAVIVPPYGTFDGNSPEEEIAVAIPDLVKPLQNVGKSVDVEIQSDGLVLDGNFITACSPVAGYRRAMRELWAEHVLTAERRVTVQPISDLLSAYLDGYKRLNPYRRRRVREGIERLTIGFDLQTGSQRMFHEVPDKDGDFLVHDKWELNTMNLDVSHMKHFDVPMRYFDYMYLKSILEDMPSEFVELHFHPNYRKGLVCVAETRLDGTYHQMIGLVMPISYIKYKEV